MLLAVVALVSFAAGAAALLLFDHLVLRHRPSPPAQDREAVSYRFAHTMGMRHSVTMLRRIGVEATNDPAVRQALRDVADIVDQTTTDAITPKVTPCR